jgi:hypothetical protein
VKLRIDLPSRGGNVQDMKSEKATVEIPIQVLESIDTLDELEDWLTARNHQIVAELRQAREDDLAGRFKPWKPGRLACPTTSK